MRFKAGAGKFRLPGVCFLACVPLGRDQLCVMWLPLSMAEIKTLSLSLPSSILPSLSCTLVHYINTHTTLQPTLLNKDLFQTFSGMAIIWWKNQEKSLTLRRTDLAIKLQWMYHTSSGINSSSSKLWRTICKTRISIFKSYIKNFNCPAKNFGSAWKDQGPQNQLVLSSNFITCISSCVALGQLLSPSLLSHF